jgi:hypothetical protein
LPLADLAAVLLDEFLALHEEAARTHGGVVDAALEGLEHLDDQGDDALGRVILAALLALSQGELPQEIFIDVAEDVLALQIERLTVVFLAVEVGIREVGDQVGQFVAVDLRAGEVFVEHILELFLVLALDGLHGIVDQPADAAHVFRLVLAGLVPGQRRLGRQLGAVAQGLPARFQRYPKDVFLRVVVAHLQLGGEVACVVVGVVLRGHVVVVVGVLKLLVQRFLTLFEGV